MSRAKLFLKRTAIIILSIILLFAVSVFAFIKLAPQFGATPSGEHLEKIKKSEHYQGNQFVNLSETKLEYSLKNMIEVMQEYSNAKKTAPGDVILTHFNDPQPALEDSTFRLTWYGHSAILLELAGKRIFLDPMLGPYAAPVPFFGKRFPNRPEIDLNSIGKLDAVIFSHDHYDHLDYTTIKAIHQDVGHFYVPLGVGSHLRKWGVPAEKITELDWWGNASLDDFTFTATPARHFSGRSIGENNKTLWASWVIKTPVHNIYFSGDGGYDTHFAAIGERLGPFDFAMMECGQYNEHWKLIHMMPEETVQASLDIKTKTMMPIHWGAFTLSPHAWIDPAERVYTAAKKNNLKLITPEIGAGFLFPNDQPQSTWWRQVK